MPYTATVEGRIVHIAWHGVVSREDLQSIGKEIPRLAAERGFAPDVLHTFGLMQGYTFQPIAAYVLALVRKRATIPHPVKSALVATTPETKKMAQLFRAMNRTPNLTMEIFDSEAAARAWLNEN